MRTLRLSYVLVIAQVGKRGQGNSGGEGILRGDGSGESSVPSASMSAKVVSSSPTQPFLLRCTIQFDVGDLTWHYTLQSSVGTPT